MMTMRFPTFYVNSVVVLFASYSVMAEERLIPFPADTAVGMLVVAEQPIETGTQVLFGSDFVSIGRAQGVVSVQPDDFVGVQIGAASSGNLDWLDSVPVDAIQSLQFSHVDVSAAMLQRIVGQAGLINLEFRGCRFEPDCFQNLASLPRLRQFRANSVNGSGYANWVAELPQLRNLFVDPLPALPELKSIADHPTLAWTSISLESDANGALQSLGRLPSLRNLTVIVAEDAEAIDSAHFASLSNLETLGWFYGSLDGEALKAIGNGQNLQKLTLLQVEVGEDFLAGLATLNSISELSLANIDVLPFTTDQLIGVLVDLPNLKRWPKLNGVSSSGLSRIAEATQLERLVIARIEDDVDLTQLQSIGKLRNLTHLELQNIKLDDDWLKCLSGLDQLGYLHLFCTDVLGHGFEQLSGLSSLQRLDIFSGLIDDEKPVPSLDALQALPNLQHLQFGGFFSPNDLRPIAELRQLQSLRLWGGGFSDDSTAEFLTGLKHLTKLKLSQNCVVSDRGAEALAKLPALEQLSVGGFLTKTGVERLASIRSLKQLSVATSLLSEKEKQVLVNEVSIPQFRLSSYISNDIVFGDGNMTLHDSSMDDSINGADGLLRVKIDDESGRSKVDGLEGAIAPEIVDVSTDPLFDLRSLKGKVVLVEFWGTWCGPCRRLAPRLKELYESHHENGFEIVGVHTAIQAERLPEYLTQKAIQWPSIVDLDGSLADAYCVPHYPSLYLIDRGGMLRVALVHRAGLGTAVQSLLDEE